MALICCTHLAYRLSLRMPASSTDKEGIIVLTAAPGCPPGCHKEHHMPENVPVPSIV